MRTPVEFLDVELCSLDAWRHRYCAGLEKAQALLLELMVPQSRPLAIQKRDQTIGYALIGGPQALIEFYLDPEYWCYGQDIGAQLIEHCQIKRALLKSFDGLIFTSFAGHQRGMKVLGLLTRDYSPRELPQRLAPEMEARIATPDDLEAIIAMEQDVFQDPSRFAQAIAAKEVIGYWSQERALVGFGMLRRVRPEHEALEINIAVDPAFRRRAYAAYIMQDLARRSAAQRMQPIASCPVDNTPSRILGERVGFSARDCILEFLFE